MQIDEITPEWLEKTIQALVRGEEPPAEAITLYLLKVTGSPTERTLALYDYLLKQVIERLTHWRHAEGLPHDDHPPSSREATVALGRDFSCGNVELEAWSALYHRHFCPISLSVQELAGAAHVAPRQLRRRVVRGLHLLADMARQDERAAHRRLRHLRLRRHLPPPDFLCLFGIEPMTDRASRLLTDTAGPALLTLDGLGGIGKTTLAQAVADRLSHTDAFADILWISARQARLLPDGEMRPISRPVLTFESLLSRLALQIGREDLIACRPEEREAALRTIFQTSPHLIVVDNLETMADYRALAARLQPMSDPTRFLLTSRRSLREYPFVYTLSVPPLSRLQSLALLRHELERQGRSGDTPDAALDAVYQVVGGLPLALKLIAVQLGRLPLAYVLDNLRQARGQMAEALYIFIYRHTWMLLDDPARQLLLNMLLVSPDGEDVEWLGLIGGLPVGQLEQVLARLLDFSLLQVTGSLEHPFYRLHRLTVTFLETEILAHWEDEQAEGEGD